MYMVRKQVALLAEQALDFGQRSVDVALVLPRQECPVLLSAARFEPGSVFMESFLSQ